MIRETLPDIEFADDPTPTDPLADLLFTLIAAVLPAILLLAPTLHRTPPRSSADAVAPSVTVEGKRAQTVVAGAAGLRFVGSGMAPIGPDAIPTSPALAQKLETLRGAGTPLLLVVEPDGLESAFLLEPLIAAHGPSRYALLRSPVGCGETRDLALATACGAGAGP